MRPNNLRVFIADDHPVVRDGLRAVLERCGDIEIVAEADNGRDAVARISHLNPDVALVDIDMPHLDGITVVKEVGRHAPDVRCVLLTMYADDRHISAAFGAGAIGYIVKGASGADIERAVRAAASGQLVVGPEVVARVASATSSAPLRRTGTPFAHLNERDLMILDALADGMPNALIAERLGYASKTIRNLISELLPKIGANDRIEAQRIARAAGLGGQRP